MMLNTLKKNSSFTFFQPTFIPTRETLTASYVGGVSSVAIADTSMLTSLQTSNINSALSQLRASLIQRGVTYARNTIESRGGFMAEDWHADTYNLDAAIKKFDTHASVPKSHDNASADIKYDQDKQASLKYNANAESSAKAQTNPEYGEQARIVPSDQLEGAKKSLDDKIDLNRKKGRDDAADIQEKAKDLLDDRIRSKDEVVESSPLTKEQDKDLAKAIETDKDGNVRVNEDKIDKVIKDTGVKDKTNNAILKNELIGLGIAAAIGAGIGFTIGFAVTLAQSGVTPDSIKIAFAEGSKAGLEGGIMSAVSYGIGRTIGQIATAAASGLIKNLGVTITENIQKICNMSVVGTMTIALFSAYQFIKLKLQGIATREALIQIGKQALISLSLLAVSIAAQGIWGGSAGIIVSTGMMVIMISYALVETVHQREFAEHVRVYMIDKCQPVFAV